MNTKSIIRRARSLCVALCLLGAAQSAFAAVGKVLFVAGSVNLERNGSRALKVGDPLDLGDVIVTAEQSRAQLLMADGARIALRASSRFRIDELALPSNVQQPGMAVAVASAGKSVGTLLKGGFSTRDGAVGKSNPAAYEMRTPIGTLGIRGTYYTAVFCRGDCADAPGLAPGQPIPDGLYLAVDEGTITFNGRGLSLTLTAPRYEFIPLETSDPQQLVDPPAFLRGDGAGRFEVAGRMVRIAASNSGNPQINDRRSPTDGQVTAGSADTPQAPGAKRPGLQIQATSPLGLVVDITNPNLPPNPMSSLAIAVPTSSQPSFTASSTQPSNLMTFNAGGSLLQFTAPFGPGATAPEATYLSGSAALLDFGSNGASSIRWGRWATGSATASGVNGVELFDLAGASVHWIIGPSFELTPQLPVTGSTNFTLAGGTSPTDENGNIGTLNGAVLVADFTAQQVSTTLSLDLNGLNWLATGSGPITAGTVRFGGTFTNVLVDGRVPGTGTFSGFFSAGPTTPDQLNGVGMSYRLADNLNQLGNVSGVLAFVPGTGQTPTAPGTQRDLSYSVGNIDGVAYAAGAATNTPTQFSVDANGDLTFFTAPLPRSPAGTLALGTASVANMGADATTGLRWGRWQNGAVDLVNPPAAAQPNDITGGPLHWIAGSSYGATPVLPTTGTASYTLVGNTDPTDTHANVGTVGSASFTADFTNRTVASALTVNVAGFNWYASGAGVFAAGSTLFNGTYTDVSVENLVRGQGNFSGFFTVPRIGGGNVAGAGLTFNLADNAGTLGAVSGALAFAEGQGTTVTPPALQQRDIAFIAPDPTYGGPLVLTTSTKGYALDTNFDLVKLTGVADVQANQSGTFDLGTSTIAESGVAPLIMVRWGRWSGGNTTVTNSVTGQVSTLNLSESSLHWVMSADAANAPVMPVSGSANYALVGSTAPTDRVTAVGVLNSATFSADFTSQSVNSTLDLTVNNLNWQVSGQGVIGAQAGLPAHQFSGAYTSGTINSTQGTATGTFSGFFTAPGSTVPGVPGGVGLTYSLVDGQGLNQVDGAAAFQVVPPVP